jgi:MFS family permease
MTTLLTQPKLRRFFIAHGQSQLGTGAGYVALVLIAYQRLHSGWAIALVLLADFLPGILLSAYFGVLADRHSRRTLAITAELIRAAAFIALAVTASFGATVAFALVAGVGTALFRPALSAALPSLVVPEERSRATALYGALQSAGFTLGPALCGLMLMFGPATWVLLVNGVTFVVSAALLVGVPLDAASAVVDADADASVSSWRAARQGLGFAARRPGVGAVLVIGATTVLCAAMINVAEPLLATGPLRAGRAGFSILVAAYGIGLVLGGLYASRLGGQIGGLRGNFLAGVAATGAALLACAAAGDLAAALGPFALAGFANALLCNCENRLLQELVPRKLLGRVFGVRDAVESASFVAAFIAAGALLSFVDARSVYILSGSLLLATVAAAMIVSRRARMVPAGKERLSGDPIATGELALRS